jgi:hypothetical protein
VRGSVVKRGEGYSVVVDLDRDPITRKRRQRWHSGYRTKREAERALSEIIASVHAGSYIEPTKQTLREFTSEWLAAIEPTIRPATHYSYSRNLRLHVSRVSARCSYVVSMGHAEHAVCGAAGRWAEGLCGGWVVATDGAVRAHDRAPRPQNAVKWGRLARNPADAADPPKASAASHPESITWTAEQLRAFLEGTRGSSLRLHDLRHGWATLALQAGVHPKVVQERLGHANIGITLDTYSHVVAGLYEDAAEQVAALFLAPVSNPLAEGT